jgi:hypothetical protein
VSVCVGVGAVAEIEAWSPPPPPLPSTPLAGVFTCFFLWCCACLRVCIGRSAVGLWFGLAAAGPARVVPASRRTFGRIVSTNATVTASVVAPVAPPPSRTLLVFFIGGVTPSELRCVEDLRVSHADCRVVVGGTTISSPARFVDDLRYMPAD